MFATAFASAPGIRDPSDAARKCPLHRTAQRTRNYGQS